MIPVNNSDTAWLIVADFNQENGLPYEDLMEDVLNPEINEWCWQHDDYEQSCGQKVGGDEDWMNSFRVYGSVGGRLQKEIGGAVDATSVGDIIGARAMARRVGGHAPY